jgi:uncharacterized membrane protein YraQ (UPF0718 family)
MYTVVFYGVALVALAVSFTADRRRTGQALRKAWKALVNIAPEFFTVIIFTGVILSFLTPETIASVIGEESGPAGVLLSSVVGSITLMPGFVAFPMAAILMGKGAGILQIAAFVSALMMVGIVTFPVERKTIGTRAALARNILAWVFSLVVAAVLALVLHGLGAAGTP